MKIKLSDFNHSGRIYSEYAIDNILNRSKNRTLMGWLNTDTNTEQNFITDVSHMIENVEIYDDGIYGECKILNTPKGSVIKQLENNIDCFGISERMLGSYDPASGKFIISKIISYDLIVDGSDLIKRRKKKIEKIMDKIREQY